MQAYNKAIVALVIPPILLALNMLGITPDMPVSEAVEVIIGGLITAVLVYIVPNKK